MFTIKQISEKYNIPKQTLIKRAQDRRIGERLGNGRQAMIMVHPDDVAALIEPGKLGQPRKNK